ncbi:MAG: tol-pal system protein YbgF [Candidatus Aminicenantales bacterium]
MKKFLILLLLLSWGVGAGAVEKSKKVYELIYEDIQLLKQQILRIEKKIDQNSEDIQAIKEQVQDFLTQFRLYQAEQARTQADLKNIPFQYQNLVEQLKMMNAQLAKISEQLFPLKNSSPGPELEAVKKEEKTQDGKKPKEEKKEEPDKEKGKATLPLSLSPQEIYNTAYSDYQKGNYELAIDGFRIYREQFPTSPLADNAQYMIGECYFSQKKFADAIEQFNDFILNYPQGDKMAAAYLKKGICYAELQRKEEAVAAFKLLITKYPLEEETKIAQQKLKELLEGK